MERRKIITIYIVWILKFPKSCHVKINYVTIMFIKVNVKSFPDNININLLLQVVWLKISKLLLTLHFELMLFGASFYVVALELSYACHCARYRNEEREWPECLMWAGMKQTHYPTGCIYCTDSGSRFHQLNQDFNSLSIQQNVGFRTTVGVSGMLATYTWYTVFGCMTEFETKKCFNIILAKTV